METASKVTLNLFSKAGKFSADRKTLWIKLPESLRKPMFYGCSCPYCKSHADKAPTWDTLSISTATGESHVVHYPELNA